MSLASIAPSRPLGRPAGRESEPERRLRALDASARRRRPRMLYAIIAVGGALAIAAAQMGLSIAMTQGVYQEQALDRQVRDLTWEKQSLTEQLAGLSSPQYLAANASALGMVVNEAPSYLRLSDGAVLGAGIAASGSSSVDAIGRGSVPNALVTDAPLVTAPDATIQGVPPAPVEADDAATAPASEPPALSDGLPSPVTR
jgi:hypothetical protein